jgi:hypothetical protein
MWAKFLYFLRIFKNTGYFIKMIVEVIKDMKSSLLVLLITVAAFGNTFSVISKGNESLPNAEKDNLVFTAGFLDGLLFTYRMILGDFDTTGFGEIAVGTVTTLFILCTVFNMIIMLNLLIAVISDTYERVAANSELNTYYERTSMLAENGYLVNNFD